MKTVYNMGIYSSYADDNTFYLNKITDCQHGISLYSECNRNNVSSNTVSNSSVGIWLKYRCNYNNITRNNLLNNYKGLRIYYGTPVMFNSTINTLYLNYFIGNNYSAESEYQGSFRNFTGTCFLQVKWRFVSTPAIASGTKVLQAFLSIRITTPF